ncbi:hypothetical protein VTK73DRAFT_6505 [Phialemonium thermophilum]|uniref:Ankyrin repeat-containing protein n=1 Tax=Phialemonium thermophilum TaxID=223376 RepID=A0ABR3WJJ7_9PEZI
MMSNILAAEPSKNDGSIHNAARELNLPAVKVLVEYGHDIDFPSPIHNGRSALSEVCLNAAHEGPLKATQEKALEKVLEYLINQGADLTIHSAGKSALLLALESVDPLPTTRALLKAGMWKSINQPFNFYNDGSFTYSPAQYLIRIMPETEARPQLLALLRANRAKEIYYANEGPQPAGAIGVPEDLLRMDRERKALVDRIALETEDHVRALARTQERARVEDQILIHRAELEEARIARQRVLDVECIRDREAAEDAAFAAAVRRRKQERDEGLRHEQALLEAGLLRARMLAEAEAENEGRRQTRQLEWERKVGAERMRSAKELSAIHVREREELGKIEAAHEARVLRRISEHKKLVDSQNSLAGKLTTAGVDGRRQIGYITGEAD